MVGCVSSAQSCCSTDLVMSLNITHSIHNHRREWRREWRLLWSRADSRGLLVMIDTAAPLPSIMNLSFNLNFDLDEDNKRRLLQQSHLFMSQILV